MACPFFYPTQKSDAIAWSFPRRLPLGAGFCGSCRARAHQVTPADSELKEFCNLGYAQNCAHLPAERRADCLRFAVADDEGERIRLHFVYERNHAPVEHGLLEYDWVALRWSCPVVVIQMSVRLSLTARMHFWRSESMSLHHRRLHRT